jgi:uncharacterized repeat protein (TIGR04052 family)
MKRMILMGALLLLGLGVACTTVPENKDPVAMSVNFAAMVGDKEFACGTDYEGIGMDKAKVSPVDFRFYVTNVRLIRASDGKEVALTLDSDDKTQSNGVALLDFEDGKGMCKSGTPALNLSLRGKIADDTYNGIKFVIGVPHELNHKDLAALPAPLNETTLSWTWNYGRIFLSAMGQNEKGVHLFHMGSSDCKGDVTNGEEVTCGRPFRPEYTITDFDPKKDTIIADWGALFAKSAMGGEVKGCKDRKGATFCGCHSRGPDDVCSGPFEMAGLDWKTGDAKMASQKLFRVKK